MTSTPIHDELQKILNIDTRSGDRSAEQFTELVPVVAPATGPVRHRRD